MAKNKPEPVPCPRCERLPVVVKVRPGAWRVACPRCERLPVVVKVRPGAWRVACPYLDCPQLNSYGETEDEAIEKWNRGEVIKG